ncbi:BnaAnng09750D [Brassica napus]|uniref:BnaAnng09750D protein n=1 Tax=Brassica napus TaxID=3708 RepID=A0A078IEE7_BRANA|nr:BnaAnng09750D [Brassica napus]
MNDHGTKEVKINEGETAVVEEKESAKEKGRSEAVLLNIVAHLEKLDQKFDSRLTEYDTKFGDFSQGLLDTIGDTVKTTVEERLRVLGVSNSSQPEGQHVMVSEDNQQPESNSGQPDGQNTPIDKQSEDSQPQKTPDKGQSEKNLADDIAKADAKGMGAKLNSKVVRDKAAGVKKNLDSAFGNADATNADLVSDSPGKEPPFGRSCRGLGKRNNLAADLERNETELKKKQKQEEAEKKKQEEAELKKKQKKEEAELKKKKKQEEADLKKKKKKKQEEADLKKDIPASKRTRSERLENSVFAILSSANRENLPVLYLGPCDLLDTTSPTWFKFLTDLSLVIPTILAEGWVHAWPTYCDIPDHFKERWFLQLARTNTWDRRHHLTVWRNFNLVARSLFRCQMRHLRWTWLEGGEKPTWMLTSVWLDLCHMFEESGPDNFGS